MITSALILVLIGVVSGKVHFNVCNARDPLYITGPVSLKQCVRSCKMDPACTWITYTSRGLVCQLHDKFEEQDGCRGSVASKKDEFDVDVDGDCTVRRCPPSSTCDQETKRCVAQAVCQPPPNISSSTVQGNMRSKGSKVKYTCADGLAIISTCQPTGQWTEVPACACEPPPTVPQSTTAGDMRTVGSVVKYTCTNGGSILESTCQSTGQWTELSACGCEAPLTKPTSVSSVSISSVTYTCETGYGLSPYTSNGTTIYSCLAPDCNDCGPPTVSDSASNITYKCNTGYELVPDTSGGIEVYFCHSGQWETPAFQCLGCGFPLTVSNADTTESASSVTYTCQMGYGLVQMTHGVLFCSCPTYCIWKPPAYQCLACGPPQNVSNAESNISGSTVTYTCDTGYEFVPDTPGDTAVYYCYGGQWGAPAFYCLDCGPPTNVSNAVSSMSGSTVTYTCDTGYEFVPDTSGGAAVYSCQDGTWETPAFKCVDCGTPQSVSNAVFNMSGSTVTYTCDTGYELVPDTQGDAAVYSCQGGTWETPAFRCNDCGPPASVSNAVINMYGSTVTYTCETGYELVPDTTGDDAVYICQDGSWETPKFQCLVKSIGLSCVSNIHMCLEENAHCLEQYGMSNLSVCVCSPLHEYDPDLRTCVQVCSTYSKKRYDQAEQSVSHFNLGTMTATYIYDCLRQCRDAYGDDCPGFQFNPDSNMCECKSISLQQANDSIPSALFDSDMFHSRKCIPVN